ncbi:putative DsbA family dithiol-disulfide isomerase [Salsuginibacillus halophilus]|uniref:Putative DsbA family dithiol-disulfide isomerase n=1 Tax=Salsuginibacillus halophilus TaxID=517424 RepID=A0A2P8H3R7_9BACI|nr:DsbA family protein [Salsuginibacillus halophilus]PSL40861.1 putative DsbA family dithiol-disulfide isomerase [Salsuginibacillus halophilus]
MTAYLTIFFDYNCPFCYTEVVKLQKTNIQAVWKAWRMPDNASPPSKPEGYKDGAIRRLQELSQTCQITINPPERKMDTFLAHTGAKAAQAQQAFDAYHKGVFTALFRDQQNIEDPEVLADIAAAAGIDRAEFLGALHSEGYHDLVHRDFAEADERSVWTIPSFIGDGGELYVHHYDQLPSVQELTALSSP